MMRTMTTIAFLAAVVAATHITFTQAAEKPQIAPQTQIDQAQKQLEETATALIAIAKDTNRSNDERRDAILLLGKTRTASAHSFLIDNVTLRIPKNIRALAVDRLLETPCLAALCYCDWDAAQAIFAALERPRTKEELAYLSRALKCILTQPIAEAIIKQRLDSVLPSDDLRTNLKALSPAP